jgi:hypothetical protein
MFSSMETMETRGEPSNNYWYFAKVYRPTVHFFSSVAHVWVPGAKTYWADRKKVMFFLNLIFS